MNPILTSVLDDLARDTTAEVADEFSRLVVSYFADTAAGMGRVSTPLTPAEIAARFDEALPETGQSMAEVIARLERDVLPDCNRLCHPRSMGHQVSAPVGAAVWAESLTAAVNQSLAVWEMSPVATVIEARVVRWMAGLAGYGPDAGGTFTSGGTEANFAGLLAARHAALPDAWRRGVGSNPPVVVYGEHAHYGIARAIGELGIGTDHAVAIPTRDFRMDVAALEHELDRLAHQGRRVMAVVGSAGSTATGSFDDLAAIARLCDARGLWFHVDGAHGASALFSATHRHRLTGLCRARSIAWDPHKMMLMPLTASVILVRDERDLDAAFTQRAPYLFHAREEARNWDQGVRSFTCSRRADALKVWIALLRYGAAGIGALYDHLCERATYLHQAIAARPEFRPLHAPEANILCFRYVGRRPVDDSSLDTTNLRLREEYNRAGTGWITTTMLGGRRVLRVTLMNPRVSEADLDRTLDDLARIGAMLEG